MTKYELILAMAKHAELDPNVAARALAGLTAAVEESLEHGDKIALIGFGSWKVAARKERRCKNPRTGEWMMIPARNVPVFRAGARLKRAMPKVS